MKGNEECVATMSSSLDVFNQYATFVSCHMMAIYNTVVNILLAQNLAYFLKFAKVRKNAYLRYFVK